MDHFHIDFSILLFQILFCIFVLNRVLIREESSETKKQNF